MFHNPINATYEPVGHFVIDVDKNKTYNNSSDSKEMPKMFDVDNTVLFLNGVEINLGITINKWHGNNRFFTQ